MIGNSTTTTTMAISMTGMTTLTSAIITSIVVLVLLPIETSGQIITKTIEAATVQAGTVETESANIFRRNALSDTINEDAMALSSIEKYSSSSSSDAVFTVQSSLSSTVRVNCGGSAFIDAGGNSWVADQYSVQSDGIEVITAKNVRDTTDQELYQYNRYGKVVVYEIPVGTNTSYDVFLHFAELVKYNEDKRVFTITINDVIYFENLDIIAEVGTRLRALSKYAYVEKAVSGSIRIQLDAIVSDALISGIEVLESAPHSAHSVPGQSYEGVDRDGSGYGQVFVDGTGSHTHRFGDEIRTWTWRFSGSTIGTGDVTTLTLPVGVHNVNLRVQDSKNTNTVGTRVTIKPYGNPIIDSLSPESIQVGEAGDALTIKGAGFTYPAEQTIVHIGTFELTGSGQITVVDESTIIVLDVPDARTTTGTVLVSVETPIGETPSVRLGFVDVVIEWGVGEVIRFAKNTFPTVLDFGPDGKLYVGTQLGHLYKLTLDDSYQVIETVESTVIIDTAAPSMRSILGITFDPNDNSANPAVYVSTSILFHDEPVAWRGDAINGKVTRISGADLTVAEDVVTGLPVSAGDHGVNGLEFGNNDDLYINVGGNTNAGVPHQRYGNLEETYLSGATLLADLSKPGFDGDVKYSPSNGDQIGGFDVTVHAPGQRNPFNLVFHSNGQMYSTDNGPNGGYGGKSTSCITSDSDPTANDELNRIKANLYYGHPNRKRGVSDSRQCIYGDASDGNTDHRAPISELQSSMNGLVEFQTSHFEGTLRGTLVMVRYKGELWYATLSGNGKKVVEVDTFLGSGSGGLDVTQGPDGTLFVTQPGGDKVIYYKPLDSSYGVTVKSVFPRRGKGNMRITVYGDNFTQLDETTTTVTVGGSGCSSVELQKAKGYLTCQAPSGTGIVNVVVADGMRTSTLMGGYRYTK